MAQKEASREEDVAGNQVNPHWANQFAHTLVNAVRTEMGKSPVIEPDRKPEDLTTESEAKIYDEMMEKDFMKIDPKTKKVGKDRTLYRPIHIYPQWQTANPNEFVAFFVIENYKWVRDPDESKRRQIITSFNLRCKEFRTAYKPTVIEAIPELEEEEVNERAS